MKTDPHIHINKFANEMFQTHGHWPAAGRQATFGHELEPGDRILPTDVYESTSGNWELAPIPDGFVLGEGVATKWVRPELL